MEINGDYQNVWKEAKKTTASLGWSGKFIEAGVPMLLLYLFEGEEMEKGMTYMRGKVKDYLNYKEEYGEPDFAERFSVWKKLSSYRRMIRRKSFNICRRSLTKG